MAGEHAQLVQLAQAVQDPAARQELMDALAAIAPYAGGGNAVADAMAAVVLAGIRAQAGQ
jgi:alkylhydroperoxidase/carboxymuconolactone decarboxylase family protein YurZ